MAKVNVKGRILGLLIVAFIVANALLIYFDEEEKVERKSYVHDWSQTVTEDLAETLETKGVFTSETTTPVYLDEELGSFQEFLVEEGDTVADGDDLYTYAVSDYYAQEAQLQGDIDRIEQEISATEAYIEELEDYEIPEPSESTSGMSAPSFFGGGNPDETEEMTDRSPLQQEDTSSNAEAEYLKQEKLAEQASELMKQEAMLEMKEDQLDQLQQDGDQITVTSTFAGTVTEISEELDAPLLTIASTDLILSGTLDESARTTVDETMQADIRVPELDMESTGSISSIDTHPDRTSVKGTSRYPFTIAMDDLNEDVLPGYHAEISIITNESPGAVTAADEALSTEENLFAWVMNEDGEMEKREIEKGITEDGLVEIVQGLEENEWLAVQPEDEFRNGTVFFTPIHIDDVHAKKLFKLDKQTKLTYGMLGFLAR
ncbi:efflux RND transporter periplasmic adaptor subunit [Bacillus sp. SB49]|uniref:efflux RND transporter periplasmic adaptor subunit n=1 Tax=Bacillaceae TaxID=186817 RepID=UPI000420E024|nr:MULTISPECIES: efflux RND transporter periplasmic adaptor subunit [Bacillaceae]QHT45368.1 efflux RND transporter periplasmic adaptor subunit [Bacillus sp. SB49]